MIKFVNFFSIFYDNILTCVTRSITHNLVYINKALVFFGSFWNQIPINGETKKTVIYKITNNNIYRIVCPWAVIFVCRSQNPWKNIRIGLRLQYNILRIAENRIVCKSKDAQFFSVSKFLSSMMFQKSLLSDFIKRFYIVKWNLSKIFCFFLYILF